MRKLLHRSAIGLPVALGAFLWGSANAQVTTDSGGLDEVVVTAEKRVATVQTTPISITAVSGDQLQAQGIATIEDLMQTTPGISMRTAGPGQTELEMRGLSSSGGAAPTVGFYLDEVPLTPAAASLNGRAVIDPDLYDLKRVEVLRGPQGTLYGSGSMGGTIKLIASPPQLGRFDASTEASLSDTHHGGVNPGISAMVNLPIAATLALRLVGTYKYTDGFIDRIVEPNLPFPTNPCTGWAGYGCTRGDVLTGQISKVIPRSNPTELDAARASLLWQPLSELSATTTVMYQRIKAEGYNQYQDPPGAGGGYAIYQPFDMQESISDTFKMLSEVITYDLSFAQFTSATSYWNRQENQSTDATESLQNLFALPEYLPVYYTENDESQQFSQELRLASTGSGRLDWVGGLFFSDLNSTYRVINQSVAYASLAAGGLAADPDGAIFDANNPYTMKQYAAFGDATYKFSPEFKLTGGLRWFKYTTVEHYATWGVATQNGNDTPDAGSINSSASGFNPKVTLSYLPSGDLTVYGTAARGFRPGGVSLPVPTSGATVCPNVPLTYKPDDVWNYEVGEKARFFDGRVQLNADVYYIKWNNIQQIIELSCGYPYTANAGNARSYGPELELSARLTSELTASLSGTYTNARINDPAAVAGAPIAPGTRILNIPDSTASLMLVYDHKLSGDMNSVTRLTDSYVGSVADIAYAPITLPSHNIVDFRTGLVLSRWAAYLFVDNLTDKRAALTTNNTSFAWQVPSITRVTTNMPRTIGLDVQFHF